MEIQVNVAVIRASRQGKGKFFIVAPEDVGDEVSALVRKGASSINIAQGEANIDLKSMSQEFQSQLFDQLVHTEGTTETLPPPPSQDSVAEAEIIEEGPQQ